jgi:hypothetical protein
MSDSSICMWICVFDTDMGGGVPARVQARGLDIQGQSEEGEVSLGGAGSERDRAMPSGGGGITKGQGI